jgi:hypothetical protein
MAGATRRARGPHYVKSRSRAELSLTDQACEAFWLQQVRDGKPTKEIARHEGLSRRRVQQGVSRAALRERESRKGKSWPQDLSFGALQERKDEAHSGSGNAPLAQSRSDDPRQPPRLVPLFPIGPFTPQSTCPHHGPIRPGSVFCCRVCSRSGMDEHPAMKRDPRPEPRAPVPDPGARETLKERRRRLHEGRRLALQSVGRF